MGCYIWYSEEVPNVTAHPCPSTASVPITVLLHDGPLHCGFNVAIKGFRIYSLTQHFCSVLDKPPKVTIIIIIIIIYIFLSRHRS